MATVSENDLVLSSPPSDGITAARFGPTDDGLLLVSSWDSALRLYDARANALRAELLQPASLLACDFVGTGRAMSGCLDGHVRLHDVVSMGGSGSDLGQHQGAVSAVRHCGAVNTTATGSWDHTVKLWDARASSACVGTFEQPDKTRESSMKSQTRCIAQMPNGTGYAAGSVEGRVAVEYIDPAAQERKYAFKCHREKVAGVDTAFSVNAIAYHPVHGTFATGGGDGAVHVWDGERKKRVCSLRKCPTSVSALDFSAGGDMLAIAASYSYDQGEREHPADSIIVRRVTPAEVRPKAPKK